jgi:hypothetical protein
MTAALIDSNALSEVPGTATQPLPSGRALVVRLGAGEEIEIRSPSGEVEVQIVLTDQGPVVRLRAARLELAASDEIQLNARRLALHSSEQTELTTAGDVRVRSAGDTHINGKMLYLNC